MKTNFCDQIDNVRRFLQAYRRLRARSVDEVCFLVVEGRQGYGKTHAIHWWATRNGCPYVRSSTTWTPRRMLQALLRHLGCPHPPGDAGACMARAAELLVAARARAEEASEDYALIIDEADLIARQRVLTETVQELGDLTGHPIVLVGNADLASRLDMHLGFSRRIWELVEFRAATIRDVGNLTRSLWQIPDSRRSGSLATQSERRAHLCACAFAPPDREHCAGQTGREPDLSGGHGGAGIGAGQVSQTDPRAQPAA